MTEVSFERNGEYIDKLIDTGNSPNDPAKVHKVGAFRELEIEKTAEGVSIRLVNSLQKLRDEEPEIINEDIGVVLKIEDREHTVEMRNGKADKQIETVQDPIEVWALRLENGKPVEPSKKAIIEP